MCSYLRAGNITDRNSPPRIAYLSNWKTGNAAICHYRRILCAGYPYIFLAMGMAVLRRITVSDGCDFENIRDDAPVLDTAERRVKCIE